MSIFSDRTSLSLNSVNTDTNPRLCSKDQYGLHSDQFPGHPDGVNCIVPVTDNVVMTGCEDGNIRAVHLYPHRFLGVVGHHEQEFPVERLDVNTSGEIIASISHDNRSEITPFLPSSSY